VDNSKKPDQQLKAAELAIINGDVDALGQFLAESRDHPRVRQWYAGIGQFSIDDKTIPENARSIIARHHFFNSWPEYEEFRDEVNKKNSLVSQFEKAVDAVVTGDINTLKELLSEMPDLVLARSGRNHRATLLHYVGANGVEDYRQKTPKNASEVAEILLMAGAEVDALGDMYGGSTTLSLVATSIHPVQTGVQKELIDILLEYGADINFTPRDHYKKGWLIAGCLANGRGEAAEYLAKRGASLDLEGAAGAGNLKKVKSYFTDDGNLKDGATIEQRNSGFVWACEYGRTNVVEFLLAHGVEISTKAQGMTGLHWAVVGGQLEMVKMLLRLNAPLEVKNCYGGTVLGQAIWSAFNEPKPQYLSIIETLIAGGAHAEPEWNQYIDEIRSTSS
jgi:ankyrin repeat protein